MRAVIALLLAMLLLPATAQATWREASTPHFVIHSEESAESLKEFATKLERFDQAMRIRLGNPDPPLGPANRLTIYVVSNVAAVQKMMGKGGRNLAGYYVPRASGSIAVVPRSTGSSAVGSLSAESVLLHEITHHFMFAEAAGAAYPAWFVEGFAEFNGTAEFRKDGSIGFGLPAVHRWYGLHRVQTPVEKLLVASANLGSPEAIEGFYARGWALTHYLTFAPTRKGQLNAYLKAINSGADSMQAARDIFGDLKVLDRELDRYVGQKRLPYLQFKSDELRIGEIRLRELSPAHDALMELRIQSDSGVDPVEARQLLARMRKAAAPFSGDPVAQAFLAEAEYDAGNHDEALAAAERALARDPNHIDALIYKGRALMAKAVATKSKDPEVWREARSWFLKANKLDPENAEPLLLFYQSHLAAGTKPSANAVAGLLKAHDLAPQDRSLRMMVARQYLVDRKVPEARATLLPIAYDPHGGQSAKLASALLTLLAGANAQAALDAFDSGNGPAGPAGKPAEE